MSQHTFLLTIQVPQTAVQVFTTSQALQGFLLDQGLWPVTALQRRWAIDPVTQGYVIELEVVLTTTDAAMP